MNLYFTEQAKKDLAELDKKTRKRIGNTLDHMKENPGSVDFKKVESTGEWRVRVGNFRIILKIDWKKSNAYVVRVLNRKDAFKD